MAVQTELHLKPKPSCLEWCIMGWGLKLVPFNLPFCEKTNIKVIFKYL